MSGFFIVKNLYYCQKLIHNATSIFDSRANKSQEEIVLRTMPSAFTASMPWFPAQYRDEM